MVGEILLPARGYLDQKRQEWATNEGEGGQERDCGKKGGSEERGERIKYSRKGYFGKYRRLERDKIK